MQVFRVSAFSDAGMGGNPAGVVIVDDFPSIKDMLSLAAKINYSETVFARKQGTSWWIRFFSPEIEVPFCGHATIALGAVLARKFGSGVYSLILNDMNLSVEGFHSTELTSASFQSAPATQSQVDAELLRQAYNLFGFCKNDIDVRIPSRIIFAGAYHLVIALKARETLAEMTYDFFEGKKLLDALGLTTLMLVFAENNKTYHVRNIFPNGGVYEDPATGSAAAAFGGYLQKIACPPHKAIMIYQGENMGRKSKIRVYFDPISAKGLRVHGETYNLSESSIL